MEKQKDKLNYTGTQDENNEENKTKKLQWTIKQSKTNSREEKHASEKETLCSY